ncbi:unnamed protein product [Medioppia subpectinata]|uniref:Uncharacterized protein n=1 Tax=Medioppia subpectinata TaxID=1979941 RepID=A0A7R9KKX0_9ACAR|nr:unnamed protein product [Medioppia subpectinata]CAG2105493.1 unnamed protein product [Medioppia subpectinata]
MDYGVDYGCNTGIGHQLALRLNELGFRVYATVLDANSAGALELTNKCKRPANMCVMGMDVTDAQQIAGAYERVATDLEANGCQLWALVNNAALITYGHIEWGNIEEYSKVIDVNIVGTLRVTRAFLPLIRVSRGRVVIMTSASGQLSMDNFGVYGSSKAALISLTHTLRREMGRFGVGVSAVEPLNFRTNMVELSDHMLADTWANTENPVRQAYGDRYYEAQRVFVRRLNKVMMSGTDLSPVVSDIVRALTDWRPKRTYRPAPNLLYRLCAPFMPLTSQYAMDVMIGAVNTTRPDFVLKQLI